MKPLILTRFLTPEFLQPNLADIAIFPYFEFVGEPLPSPDELAAYLGSRTSSGGPRSGGHWSDFSGYWDRSENKDYRDLSLAEFCQQYEAVELWFDTRPKISIAIDLAARLLPFLSGRGGQIEIASP